MIRWILLGMFSIGVLLLFPDIAFADNCSNPGDCWGTAAGGAATAGGAGGLVYLRMSKEAWRRLPKPPGPRINVRIDIDINPPPPQRENLIEEIDSRDQMRRFVRDIGRSIRKSKEERQSREFLEKIGRGLSSKDRNED